MLYTMLLSRNCISQARTRDNLNIFVEAAVACLLSLHVAFAYIADRA